MVSADDVVLIKYEGRLPDGTVFDSADQAPLDADCHCPVCTTWSRAYLHHLVRSGEMLGAMLMTQHNLHYYQDLMQGMRDAIAAGTFAAFQQGFDARYRR